VTVVVLPGDGIGPEVMREALRALERVAPDLELEEHLFGARAIRATGDSLPEETLAACKASEAVLKGPIGDPEFDAAEVRPEQGMLRLRAELDVYANLRPSQQGRIDILIVRELVGGLYFGARGVREDGTVYDTMEYHPRQVERVARRAFELARARRKRVVSVDKANVLETSRMWRRVVTEVADDYDDVALEHMLVDNAAMQFVLATDGFDVVLTENLFGDILSDLAASLTGGIGLAPSASLSDSGPGLFEPVHGSAPDIVGTGVANPMAMLLSAALMLEHGLGRTAAAQGLRAAVWNAHREMPAPERTSRFGDAVLGALA
jgi:3-isopropylmalate dehydrogenase